MGTVGRVHGTAVRGPQPEGLAAGLVDEGVDFIIIGGFAAIAHGAPRVTRDLDVVVEPTSENLVRLKRMLDAVAARRLGTDAPLTEADLAELGLGATLHTITHFGRFDVVGAPAGAAPYADLRGRAVPARLGGTEVSIAGLDDLIAMKRAAGRELDLRDIADLTEPPA